MLLPTQMLQACIQPVHRYHVHCLVLGISSIYQKPMGNIRCLASWKFAGVNNTLSQKIIIRSQATGHESPTRLTAHDEVCRSQARGQETGTLKPG